MITRHRTKAREESDFKLSEQYDFDTVANFICTNQKKTLLVQMPAEFIPFANEFRLAIIGALKASSYQDFDGLFIGFLADNSYSFSAEIPACCCVEARIASFFQKHPIDGLLHFGPACSIVCSLPVFGSEGSSCSCAAEARSLPILYVPRRIRLPKATASIDTDSAYMRLLQRELSEFISSTENRGGSIGFVFGESVSFYLRPVLEMLIAMHDAFVAADVDCPYRMRGASSPRGFLRFAQQLIDGDYTPPDPLHTSSIGLLPVVHNASRYFVFSLSDSSVEKRKVPADMAIHALSLLCAKHGSSGSPQICVSDAYAAFCRGGTGQVTPTLRSLPNFILKRMKQFPFLMQSVMEAPVIGLFMLNNTVGTQEKANNAVALSKLLRYYLTACAGKKVYEFYFNSASSSSIVDCESDIESQVVASESPGAAFLTKFSHFLPQLSLGIMVTDCAHKSLDIIECCVNKKYPIPILTALEAIESMRLMDDKFRENITGSSFFTEIEQIPQSLYWDPSFVELILESSSPTKPGTGRESTKCVDGTETTPPPAMDSDDQNSLVFSTSAHAIARIWRLSLMKERKVCSADPQMPETDTPTSDQKEGQVLKSSGNALSRPCDNPFHFALAPNAFTSLQSTQRSYTGLDISSVTVAEKTLQSEIRMGKSGIPAAYQDL
ncbi:hypothetical protein XU18_2416 [Perkinsela sp. CCAP 1560/4]|nr:hypothetical protein XU18_2416 [Perkinsela sp. CCAP 1560/4]|eukprot:KNH06814.1 hypothetical protein XU18_2416 [Perkinsela sp. CCAP 1560/4]